MHKLYAIYAVIAAVFDRNDYPYHAMGTKDIRRIGDGIYRSGGNIETARVAAEKRIARRKEQAHCDPLEIQMPWVDENGETVKATLARFGRDYGGRQ